MDQNATQAINMAFATIVFVMALSISMMLFTRVSETADILAFYSDSTKFYENIELANYCEACKLYYPIEETKCADCGAKLSEGLDDAISRGTERYVSAETIIPTLYRYYKENFCVKIYDADNKLIQIFDVNTEGDVRSAIGDTTSSPEGNKKQRHNDLLKINYDDETKDHYLYGAPWLGSTENVKTRVDYFINGDKGYINNIFIDYSKNKFHKAREQKIKFKEQFVSYSYTGETFVTDEGDELVTGAQDKDKIIITYTLTKNPNPT